MTTKVHNAVKAGVWFEPGARLVTLTMDAAPTETDIDGSTKSGTKLYNTVDAAGSAIAANAALDYSIKALAARATILAVDVNSTTVTVMVGQNYGLTSTDLTAIIADTNCGVSAAVFSTLFA